MSELRADKLFLENSSNSIDTTSLISKLDYPINDWAAKAGPTSWQKAFTNVWAKSSGSNKSISHSTYTNGLQILKDGYYEVFLHQRMTGGGDNYLGLAVDGDRPRLEDRVDGVWTHSHGTYSSEFTDSYYIGKLYAGELITGGGASSTNFLFGSTGTVGTIRIIRIG
jgi:hypothetical protein